MSDIIGNLVGELAKAGAPALGKIIGSAIGGPAGAIVGGIAGKALEATAEALGVEPTPEAVTREIQKSPAAAAEKIAPVEAEMASIFAAEAANLAAGNKVIGDWSMFKDGWRPGLCWSLVLMWLWGMIVTPMLFAGGIKIPPMQIDNLLAFSTVVLTVLGVGHTAKAIFGKV